MFRVKGRQDLWSGIMFLVFGVIMYIGAMPLAQGTAIRMGPGYTPRLLCYLLIIVGAALIFRGVTHRGESTGLWGIRPLIFVLGSVVVFAVGLERLGLVITTCLSVFVGSFAMKEVRPLELLIVAVCMAAGSTLLFVYALKLIIPVWPQF